MVLISGQQSNLKDEAHLIQRQEKEETEEEEVTVEYTLEFYCISNP